MLHNSTFTFGVRSRDREGTHSPGLNPVPDCARTTAYVLYAIVFQETSVRHTRARTLFVLLAVPILPSLFRRHLPGRAFSLFLFEQLHHGVTLHLAPVSRVVGSYSQRFERTRDDTVSPFLSFPSALSCPGLPLFIRSMSLQGRKRIVEVSRVDRPAIAWQLLDPRSEKSTFAGDVRVGLG